MEPGHGSWTIKSNHGNSHLSWSDFMVHGVNRPLVDIEFEVVHHITSNQSALIYPFQKWEGVHPTPEMQLHTLSQLVCVIIRSYVVL